MLFLFGSATALAWSRRWRDLALFCALSALLCLGSVALLNHATQDWFGYYCFKVPMANGVRLDLALAYFLVDMPPGQTTANPPRPGRSRHQPALVAARIPRPCGEITSGSEGDGFSGP